MGYRPNVNCIYNEECCCQHLDNRKRFLLFKYKPICDSSDGCKLAKALNRPSRPPTSLSSQGIFGILKSPDEKKRHIHVCDIKPNICTTSFGTFKRVNDKWLWVCDHRYSLSLEVST